jgi:eukaryotic-like serine/threonine-protein kinase
VTIASETDPLPPRVFVDLSRTNGAGTVGTTSEEPTKRFTIRPEPVISPGAPLDEKHVVDEEIGRGGMGRVLKVRDVDLNRDVAMKVLLEGSGDPTRFIEEAQITGQLDHPNVLPVHDMGIGAQGELFFTMKLVRGHKSLKDWIRRLVAGDKTAHAEMTFERRVQIVQQLCDVVEYAHQRGVVHRDIKPGNVVLGSFGEVYLVDWGVAKLVEPETAPGELPSGEIVNVVGDLDREETREGQILGTVPYMAPEQVMGRQEAVGPWSDIYSLSALLYEFLTLEHYLSGASEETYIQTLTSIVHHVPAEAETWFSLQNGRVPRSLSHVCRKGLSKSPAERYASAREIREELQLWLEGRSPIVCPGTAMQRGLSTYSRWIDRHPVSLPLVSLFAGLFVLQAAVQWAWQLVVALTS